MKKEVLMLLVLIPIIFLALPVVSADWWNSTLNTGLVSYWKLDETSGTLYDAVKTTGNNLTSSGSPIYNVTGKINTALEFTQGSNKYARKTNVVGLNDWNTTTPRGTINFWVYPKNVSSSTILGLVGIGKTTKGNGLDRQIGIYYTSNTSATVFYSTGNNPGYYSYMNTNYINPNAWHMVTMVYEGNTTPRFYTDGVYWGMTISCGVNNITSPAFTIGYDDDLAYYSQTPPAIIDEVAIWNNVSLNSSQITELYNGGSGLPYIPNVPPKYYNIGTNITDFHPPIAILHSVNWMDNINLSGYIFSSNYSGSWTNDTWITMIGTSNWSNVTKTGSTIGVWGWGIYANDSYNEWNYTEI